MSRKKSEPFEDALKKLQAVVEKLERGDLPLEEAVESFTEGIRLVQFCHRKLEEAEKKVQVLMADPEGGVSALPFEAESSQD
ncbi:MAG TPA: exodeoxyribonuclease VII small subunit [Syntrophobacteraceae bacterium]|nr:exodeoxyribonuclease VII small subunit [Syntrophobacteraceae bacterium]